MEAHRGGWRRGNRRLGLARPGPGRLAHRSVWIGHGRHANRLSGAALRRRPGPELPADAEDAVLLLARMASGAMGSIEATKLATGSEDELRLEVHGSRGRCVSTAWTPITWNCTTPRRGPAAGRPAGLESDRRRPALSASGNRFSHGQGGHRLAFQPHGLLGKLSASVGRRPTCRARPATRHSRPVPDGVSAAVGPGTPLG